MRSSSPTGSRTRPAGSWPAASASPSTICTACPTASATSSPRRCRPSRPSSGRSGRAGRGRTGVFAAEGRARTFDVAAGDVGYVPFAMGHYIENTGDEPLRFLEVFRSERFADISLAQWLALTPPALVREHLHDRDGALRAPAREKRPVVR